MQRYTLPSGAHVTDQDLRGRLAVHAHEIIRYLDAAYRLDDAAERATTLEVRNTCIEARDVLFRRAAVEAQKIIDCDAALERGTTEGK